MIPRPTFLFFSALLLAACGGGSPSSPPPDAGPEGSPDAASDAAPEPAPLACGANPSDAVDPSTTPEIGLSGDLGSTGGVFDPSIVYPRDAIAGAMSYSSVASTSDIHTRIAVSTDRGATFKVVADANATIPLTIPSSDAKACPSGMCSGSLIHEVSSLVLDDGDPDPARRWKLFSHRYLILPGDVLRYDYGNIALQTAPAPEGPWSGDVVAVGWASSSPFSDSGAAFRLGDAPALKDCVVGTEPAAVVVPGVGIDLALGCLSLVQGQPSIRVVLLRTADHGKTFSHVSTLLEAADAPCLDAAATRVNAADLFFVGGKEYLLATPESPTSGYHGCFVFPIDDPAKGLVRRNGAGEPVFLRRVDVTTGQFAGACTYAEGATALGLGMPVGFLNETRRFRIFSTGIALP